MSGKISKLLRKTAKVIGISADKLKAGYRRKNHIERGKVNMGLRKSMHLP